MNTKKHNFRFYVRLFGGIDSILGFIYILRNKEAISAKDEESYRTLSRGIRKYPKSARLHRELGKLEILNNNWNAAVVGWEKVFDLTFHPLATDYIQYSKALHGLGHTADALSILQKGQNKHPNNAFVVNKLIDISVVTSNYENIIIYSELWNELSNKNKGILSYNQFISLYEAYKIIGSYEKAKNTLDKAMDIFPTREDELLLYYGELSIQTKDWISAVHYYEKYVNDDGSIEAQITLAILYKIVGDPLKFETLFKQIIKKNEEKVKKDPLGVRKITLYDNGESRIEFYKSLKETDSVIITFDAINMTWDKPSFAFKLLKEKNIDIIAIRKKTSRTYQQDLHQEEFVKVIKPLLAGYEDKMAYGFSLGAYHTLYFATLLDCRVLAISPRLSIHPEFGRTKIIPKYKMHHKLNFEPNDKVEPIIVYDPKNSLDKNYITNGIIPYFSNTKIVNIPYGGHGIAPHLLKTGQLKSFVYSFLDNKVPVYDRTLRVKSPIYFKNLGNECLNHNKLNWALDLANRSLEMEKADKTTIKLKIKVLKKMNKLEEARDFATKSIKSVPNNLDIRLYLTDIYIELGEYDKAYKEIEKNKKKFGAKESIEKRINRLKEIKY